MNFDKFLRVLGLEKRLDVDSVTKEGSCSITLDNKITINIECDEKKGIVHSYCLVKQRHQSQQEVLFALLLQAHMFGVETDGCRFGYHIKNDGVLLFNSIEIESLNNETALNQLDSLVMSIKRAAEFVHRYLYDEARDNIAANQTSSAKRLIKNDFLEIVEKLSFSYTQHTKNTAVQALVQAENRHQEALAALKQKNTLYPVDVEALYQAQVRVDQAKAKVKAAAEFAAIMRSIKKLFNLNTKKISPEAGVYL